MREEDECGGDGGTTVGGSSFLLLICLVVVLHVGVGELIGAFTCREIEWTIVDLI